MVWSVEPTPPFVRVSPGLISLKLEGVSTPPLDCRVCVRVASAPPVPVALWLRARVKPWRLPRSAQFANGLRGWRTCDHRIKLCARTGSAVTAGNQPPLDDPCQDISPIT